MQFFVGALILTTTLLFSLGYGVDEIKKLPGVKFNVTFNHYSGYLQVSDTHFLHYWFVESQNDPANDPLIFWYNGGPGCSSLIGLLTEMGPYLINSNGHTLHENPNAWNKFASVVYIEAPAGVGFSYASDGNTTTNDDQTAEENYQGIKEFFKRHPKFRNHSTFITGESYGGVYIPMLTDKILEGDDDFPVKLAGMAIGNGLLNDDLNEDTALRFQYYHGFLDETLWTEMEKKCCKGCMDTCNLANITDDECNSLLTEMAGQNNGINPYNIYDTCDPTSKLNSKRFQIYQKELLPKTFHKNNKVKIGNGQPCSLDSQITTYLNLPYVRRALNIKHDLPEWAECGDIGYNRQYFDMTPFFEDILDEEIPILLYYGDVDMVCNFLHGQKFVSRLLSTETPRAAWFVNGQNAGFQTIYEGLKFITIRGAGHMAPGWKALQTSYALKQFVSNQPI